VTILDAVLIALLIGAAWSGYRQGLLTAVLALAGALGGALAGLRLAPLLMGNVDDNGAKVALGIVCVILGVGVGEYAGATLGRLASARITWRPVRAVDRGLGLVGQALAVAVIAWMIALPLAKTPYPWLSSAVRSSSVLTTVDEAMPSGLRTVSGKLGDLFDESGFPQILDPLATTPVTDVDQPDSSLASSAAVVQARGSILKVRSMAPSCGKQLEGTGFVIAPDRVLTNAHVVAGAERVTVEVGGGSMVAEVVLYDPEVDVAVLAVDGLEREPLEFAADPAETGDDAIVAGYPLDGPFTVRPARVRNSFDLRGPDIYGNTGMVREVYTVRGLVQSGNSGGPLLAPDGTVLGVVFGAAPDVEDVGFVLTADEVGELVAAGSTDDTPAATGACTAA